MNPGDNIQMPWERRKEHRIPIVFSVIEKSPNGKTLCIATDISYSGMGLKRAGVGSPDSSVILEFTLPGIKEKIEIPSKLIRVKSTEGQNQQSVAVFEHLPQSVFHWLECCGISNTPVYIT